MPEGTSGSQLLALVIRFFDHAIEPCDGVLNHGKHFGQGREYSLLGDVQGRPTWNHGAIAGFGAAGGLSHAVIRKSSRPNELIASQRAGTINRLKDAINRLTLQR